MAGSIPFYLTAQLKSTLREICELAAQKGLEQAFQMELFSLDRDVTEALDNDDLGAAARTLQRLRAFDAQITAASDKNDGMMLR